MTIDKSKAAQNREDTKEQKKKVLILDNNLKLPEISHFFFFVWDKLFLFLDENNIYCNKNNIIKGGGIS